MNPPDAAIASEGARSANSATMSSASLNQPPKNDPPENLPSESKPLAIPIMKPTVTPRSSATIMIPMNTYAAVAEAYCAAS